MGYFFVTILNADLEWDEWNDPGNVDLAGATVLFDVCGANRRIPFGFRFYNFRHFKAIPHNDAQKQCTAIHEFGHAVGGGEA